jgi:hypothetical protein
MSQLARECGVALSGMTMVRHLSTATVIAVIFFILFASVAYACSGLGSMQILPLHASMNAEKMEKDSCDETKEEICQFLRHRMVSIQASRSQAEILVHGSTLPQAVLIKVPMTLDLSLVSAPSLFTFHPLFKLSLTYSYLVLRI